MVILLTVHLIKEEVISTMITMTCQIGNDEISDLPNNKNIFMFGLQTKDRRQFMVEGGKLILLLDETHCKTNIWV